MKKLISLTILYFITFICIGQITNGLVLKYDFNGNLNDQSGLGNNGIFNGTSFTTGANGLANNAAYFDGNSSVLLPNVSSIKPNLPVTVSFLVKVDNLSTNRPIYHSDVYYNNYAGFWINIATTGQIYSHISSAGTGGGPTNRRTFATNETITVGTWNRITVVIKAYNNMDIYINCIKATGSYSGSGPTTMSYSSNPGYVGQGASNSGLPTPYYFNGSMDEISVWNRELLSYEILSLCDCQSSVYPSNGKMVHYPLNGNGVDMSLFSINTTVMGATSTNDRIGNPNKALYFDGINDYMVLPNHPNIKSPLPITVAFWVRIDQANSQQFFHSDHVPNTNFGYWFGVDASNKVHINFGGGQLSNSAGRRSKTSSTALTIGQWHHIVGVIRGVNDMDIYIDCVNAGGTYSGTGVTSMSYSANDGRIGSTFQINPNPILYLNGAMDEFAIWNRSLSAAEVSAMCGCISEPIITVDTTINMIACDSYDLNGTTYNQTGSYSQTTTSVFGIDSIINLNLTINNSNLTLLNFEGCDSVVYNGINYYNSGLFTYNYTNLNGCDSIVEISVVVHQSNPTLISAGQDTAICENENINLAAFGGIIYSWQSAPTLTPTNVSNPTVNPISTTTYFVTIEDINGCIYLDSVEVLVNPNPTANAGADVEICPSDTIQLSASGGLNYLWNSGSFISDNGIPNPSVAPTVTTNFEVQVTNQFGCSSFDSVLVVVQDVSHLTAGSNTSICLNNQTQLQASGGIIYNWETNSFLSDLSISNPIAAPTSPTYFYVTIEDSNGCSTFDSVLVDVNPLPLADAGSDSGICIGQTIELNASGGSQYVWVANNTLNSTLVSNPIASPLISQYYYVTVFNSFGCNSLDSVFVEVFNLPNVIASDDVAICLGDSIELNVTGAVDYIWSPNNSINNNLISNVIVFPSISQNYLVMGTDNNGCQSMDSVLVTVFTIETSGDTSICKGESVELLVYSNSINSYVWTPSIGLSATNVSNPIATPDTTTMYTVNVINGNGCNTTNEITVIVNELPNAQLDYTFEANCIGLLYEFNNSSINAASAFWSFGDNTYLNTFNASHIYPFASNFTGNLLVFTNEGCPDTASFEIISPSFDTFIKNEIPNVFTPNKDGVNDYYTVPFNGNFSECLIFEIYNRWGQLVYKSIGDNISWDGKTSNGLDLPSGVYYYMMEIKDYRYNGSITVFR